MAQDRNRKAGRIQLTVDGVMYEAKGDFTVNTGVELREAIVGADRVHGYKATPQVASIEGALTDSGDLDTIALRMMTNVNVFLQLDNGKSWLLEDAWFSGESGMTTGEGEIPVKWESTHQAVEMKG
jgi:hypothetical protein